MTVFGPVDEAGWLRGVARRESPYCDQRPAGVQVELLVIHSISLPPGVFGSGDVARLFTGQLDSTAHPFYASLGGLRVSAHFLIERDGAVTQFVSCDRRAWHAGVSTFEGRPACNDFSVGVELEGCDFVPFTDAQYEVLGQLLIALRARYPLRAVRGHSHIAPGRKTDPGPLFDWHRLRTYCPPTMLPPAN
ncbi:MAG: 1,6-anhydro-N-acetylmuramyl-L-alanine amidase AmpD [Sutterellaceae bacterium]|nr:1,6-anhydro-N-acetylmuramyl-L-alanine amidase AmpD [Burkholderiaceae bacterium]MDW8429602.1 1,6-anhydro-N-acetylmuramyl-L-alanine amidase AmpD [Sutterellaceae bacterium]